MHCKVFEVCGPSSGSTTASRTVALRDARGQKTLEGCSGKVLLWQELSCPRSSARDRETPLYGDWMHVRMLATSMPAGCLESGTGLRTAWVAGPLTEPGTGRSTLSLLPMLLSFLTVGSAV